MSAAVVLRLLAAIDAALPVAKPQPPSNEQSTTTTETGGSRAKRSLQDFAKFAVPESQLPSFLTDAASSSSSSTTTAAAGGEKTDAETARPLLERVACLGDVQPLQLGSKEDVAYGLCALQGCWLVEAVIRFRLNGASSSSSSSSAAAAGASSSAQVIPILGGGGASTPAEKVQQHRIHKHSPVLLTPLQSVVDAVKLADGNLRRFNDIVGLAAAGSEQSDRSDEAPPLVDASCLQLLLAAQKALVFANALLNERLPPHSPAAADSCPFVPKLPGGMAAYVTVERLGVAMYIYSNKSRLPAVLWTLSPTLALVSAILVDAMQNLQLLIRNVQAELDQDSMLPC